MSLYDDAKYQQIFNSLSLTLREIIQKTPRDILGNIEEIRVRKNKPLMIQIKGEDSFVSRTGDLVKEENTAYMVTDEDVEISLQLICQSSIYAYSEEIKNGYITIPGGHRVGITGRVVSTQGKIKTIKHISGLNYRVSKEVKGAADKILPYIIESPNSIYHTLVISPPQCGKTTLIRDLARQLSNGCLSPRLKGQKVTIVDERSEISGCYKGVPQNDVGIRTDILDGCPKAEGIIMAIRSMSPNTIITDEIGRKEDIEAIAEALNAGVSIITTVHGSSYSDITTKPILSEMITKKFFDRIIILSGRRGPGTVEGIFDGSGRIRLDRRD